MQRVSLRRAQGSESKGVFSFAKENTPFGTPRERRFFIASKQLEEARCLPMLLPARGVAALALLYDLVCSYYPLPLCPSCRSTPNHRLSRYSSMRRAQQAAFGKQSAAEQTSLAPHDSKARLRVVTTCRRFMAKPCTPHPTAPRVQLFELLSCNGGVKGQSPLRSLGGPRGPFSHVREWPPYPCSAIAAASPSRAVRGKLPHPLGKSKKCNFFEKPT